MKKILLILLLSQVSYALAPPSFVVRYNAKEVLSEEFRKLRDNPTSEKELNPVGLIVKSVVLTEDDYYEIRAKGLNPDHNGTGEKRPKGFIRNFNAILCSMCNDFSLESTMINEFGVGHSKREYVTFIIDPEYIAKHPEECFLVGNIFRKLVVLYEKGIMRLNLEDRIKYGEKFYEDCVLIKNIPWKAVKGIIVKPEMEKYVRRWEKKLKENLDVHDIDIWIRNTKGRIYRSELGRDKAKDFYTKFKWLPHIEQILLVVTGQKPMYWSNSKKLPDYLISEVTRFKNLSYFFWQGGNFIYNRKLMLRILYNGITQFKSSEVTERIIRSLFKTDRQGELLGYGKKSSLASEYHVTILSNELEHVISFCTSKEEAPLLAKKYCDTLEYVTGQHYYYVIRRKKFTESQLRVLVPMVNDFRETYGVSKEDFQLIVTPIVDTNYRDIYFKEPFMHFDDSLKKIGILGTSLFQEDFYNKLQERLLFIAKRDNVLFKSGKTKQQRINLIRWILQRG